MSLDVRWLPSVPSTMDVVAAAAHAGAPEGLVVVADEQTSGRGRRGRQWSSPPGAGVYLSFLFRPASSGSEQPAISLLTLAAGVAVREAILCATGLAADLKWPNDVMIGRRKLAGILAEAVGIGTGHEVVILGVGVNVLAAAHAGDVSQRATSLQGECGREIDRARVLEELLVAVARRYDDLRHAQAGDILREWRAAAPSASGMLVEWAAHDGVRRGTTMGIDESGALLVRTADGVERIVGGEVRWLS